MTSLFQSIESSDIKPSMVVMGLKNTHQPSNFWIPETIEHRVMSFICYIGFWIFILYGIKANIMGHKTSMIIGFIIGLFLLILYDFLTNSVISLAVDQNTGDFVAFNPDSQNILLDDKTFKLDTTQGLVIKKTKYDKMVKEKKISSTTLQKFRDNQYVKTLGGENQETPFLVYKYSQNLLLSGSYMFIILITACIVASHHNKTVLGAMLPFATTSGVLAVAVIGLWFVDRNYTGLVTTEKIKSKVFITAFSFALTTIITPFFYA